jgi:hypothetical protein
VRRGGRYDSIGSRPYRPGDDPRRIDHHASARLSAVSDAEHIVVREHLAEEQLQVAVAIDDAPTMSLYPNPWLSKSAATTAVLRLLATSAAREGCGFVPLERLPLAGDAVPGRLRTGSVVFVVSDFLAETPFAALEEAAARSWDSIAVIVQDPLWEQSFPDVSGACVPFAEPGTDAVLVVRLSRSEALARRAAHEQRLTTTLRRIERAGADRVLLGSTDDAAVLAAFLDWADGRREAMTWRA